MSSPRESLNNAHRLTGWRARWTRRWLSLKYRIFHRGYRRLVLEKIPEAAFVVLPDVFNPVLFRIGPFLGRAASKLIASKAAASAANAPIRVLDVGTGSGVCAVLAAQAGAAAVATDINPEAVRCAKINALLNDLEERIEVRRKNLLEDLHGERFDLVLFSPPFYIGRPRDWLDCAWRSEDVFERFAEGLPAALKPDGQALIALSTDGAGQYFLNLMRQRGFDVSLHQQEHWGNEIAAIYSVRPQG
ncbi:MAG: methyltransferase [Elusimicrobia bacterium]|nr:methyltransferase [Elusimicrobiota bacterium]